MILFRFSIPTTGGGILKTTKTEASAKLLPMHPVLKQALLEWKMQSHRTQLSDFRGSVSSLRWSESSQSCGGLKEKDSSCIREGRDHRRWLAYVLATSWNVAGRVGRASVDNPRLLAAQQPRLTNKYLQTASQTKCNTQARLVEAIVPVHLLPGKTAETVCTLIAKVPSCKPLKRMAGTTRL